MKSARLVAAASLVGAAASLWSAAASATILQKPRAVSAFYTPDDGYMHAIVAQDDGGIREVYFVDQSFVSSSVIASFQGIVGVASYYTPVDHFRHVIVALANGQVWEVYYNPANGVFQDLLTTVDTNRFGRMVSVAGWVTPDATQNVAISTNGSWVLHYSYYTHPLALESFKPGPVGAVDMTGWCNGGVPGAPYNETENYVSVIGTSPGSPPWILTYEWPATGSLANATVVYDTKPASESIVSLGGIANPGISSSADVLYIEGNQDDLEEDFGVLSDTYGVPPSYATSLPGTGFALGAAIEPSGRRHAVVATSWGLIDYYATGAGRWGAYWLGTY